MLRALPLVVLVGCSYGRMNQVGAGLALAATACDWGSTRQAAGDGWMARREGGFPAERVMGSTPTRSTVDVYFAIGALALLGAARLAPERYRWIAYGAIAAGEAWTAYGNLKTTRGICGVR